MFWAEWITTVPIQKVTAFGCIFVEPWRSRSCSLLTHGGTATSVSVATKRVPVLWGLLRTSVSYNDWSSIEGFASNSLSRGPGWKTSVEAAPALLCYASSHLSSRWACGQVDWPVSQGFTKDTLTGPSYAEPQGLTWASLQLESVKY